MLGYRTESRRIDSIGRIKSGEFRENPERATLSQAFGTPEEGAETYWRGLALLITS